MCVYLPSRLTPVQWKAKHWVCVHVTLTCVPQCSGKPSTGCVCMCVTLTCVPQCSGKPSTGCVCMCVTLTCVPQCSGKPSTGCVCMCVTLTCVCTHRQVCDINCTPKELLNIIILTHPYVHVHISYDISFIVYIYTVKHFTHSSNLDSPFPEGNPDSFSPSSSSFSPLDQSKLASSSSSNPPGASQQQQDTVFIIDELAPQDQSDLAENEREDEGSGPPRPPSPSRMTSITEEEALGMHSSCPPLSLFLFPSLSYPLPSPFTT